MSLVPSLLQAIVRVDGEALVMHVGEKPYVVSPTGQIDLASRGLTFEAVNGLVTQLLPHHAMKSLEEVGATQFELPAFEAFPGEHFTVTAARGGDDLWAEIRRRPAHEDDLDAADLFAGFTTPESAPAPGVDDDLALPQEQQLWPDRSPEVPVPQPIAAPELAVAPVVHAVPAAPVAPVVPVMPAATNVPAHVPTEPVALVEPIEVAARAVEPVAPPTELVPVAAAAQVADSEPDAPVAPVGTADAVAAIAEAHTSQKALAEWLAEFSAAARSPRADVPPATAGLPAPATDLDATPSEPESALEPTFESAPALVTPSAAPSAEAPAAVPVSEADMSIHQSEFHPFASPMQAVPATPAIPTTPAASTIPAAPVTPASVTPVMAAPAMSVVPTPVADATESLATNRPATIASVATTPEAPMSQSGRSSATFVPFPSLVEVPQSAVVVQMGRVSREGGSFDQGAAPLERLVRLASTRGATALYLSAGMRPSIRLDGDVQTLEGAAALSASDIDALLLGAAPEQAATLARMGAPAEWVWDLNDIGSVRCTSFRDHRGSGAVFRIVPVKAQSAAQLGLSREIQSLVAEPEGLVLVSGPRASGKSTLISSLVDVINRTRRDYVITIESEVNVVHERHGAFISQREIRGGSDEALAVARAALREDPDVLVIDDLRTSGLMSVALDAASNGQLVIGGVPAHHASGAVERLIDLYHPEQRRGVQLSLAQNLRGVVSQVLLRKSGGGRVAAREILLNTPIVSSLLSEGRTNHLPVAIEGGRKSGMVPLNDALVGFVQSGAVDVREAYRRSVDRAGLLDLLKRQGIDTSFVERLA